jgi:hypothetical protein
MRIGICVAKSSQPDQRREAGGMMRTLCAGLTAVSTLVFLAACWAWERSHVWDETGPHLVYVESPSHHWLKFQTYPGTLQCAFGTHELSAIEGWQWIRRHADGERVLDKQDAIAAPSIASLGNEDVFLNDVWGGSSFLYPATMVRVRFWAIALSSAVVPTVVTCVERRRRLRRRAGHCHRCGYDLRETPDRCPECGTSTSGK